MSEVKAYRSKPRPAFAIQILIPNIPALKKMVQWDEGVEVAGIDGNYLAVGPEEEPVMTRVLVEDQMGRDGDWLVRDSMSQRLSIMEHADFRERYVEIPPDVPMRKAINGEADLEKLLDSLVVQAMYHGAHPDEYNDHRTKVGELKNEIRDHVRKMVEEARDGA